jgi:cobalt-zinc-cadmium efflux system protein
VHHVHVWALSGDLRALSCHIVVEDQPIAAAGLILEEVRHILAERFGIGHATIQLESDLPAPTGLLEIHPFKDVNDR